MCADLTLERLTLVFPPGVETVLLELLLEFEPPLPGFTVMAADGHGADFSEATLREQVRGRVARRMLLMVLPGERVAGLIAHLRKVLPNPHIAWWVEPVTAIGRLA